MAQLIFTADDERFIQQLQDSVPGRFGCKLDELRRKINCGEDVSASLVIMLQEFTRLHVRMNLVRKAVLDGVSAHLSGMAALTLEDGLSDSFANTVTEAFSESGFYKLANSYTEHEVDWPIWDFYDNDVLPWMAEELESRNISMV